MVIEHLEHGESLSELFMPQKSYIDEYGISKIQDADVVYPNFKNDTKQLKINKKDLPVEEMRLVVFNI